MDSTVDAMAAAYDALLDAAATAVREPGRAAPLEDLKRCLDDFKERCDRAEDLVQGAAAALASSPSGIDELCRTVHAIEKDLVEAAAALAPSPSVTTGLDALCRTVHAIEKDLVEATAAADVDERDEKEVDEDKDSAPTPPVTVTVAAEDE